MVELSMLDSGLRLLTATIPHVQSVSLGFYLRVGSRYESDELAGASHFIEHMLFKGTARRPTARELAEDIEGRGGVFNATTGTELTVYWAKVAANHLPVAMDVLSDMLLASAYDPVELEKERQVIAEEIQYSLDMADSLSQIVVNQLQWPGHPLGRDVAGTRDSIFGLQREALRAYQSSHYLPGEAIVAMAGHVTHEEALSLAETYLDGWQASPPTGYEQAPPNHNGPCLEVHTRDIQQSHLTFSFAGLSRSHPDRFALSLLNVILGEGMRSRLFQEIRERLGLAYSVESYLTAYADCGAVGIYAGVAGPSTEVTLRAILAQLDGLRQEPVPEDELHKAKEYTKGRLVLGLEDPAALAGWYTRQHIMRERAMEPEEVLAAIDAVQPTDVQRLAQSLFRTDSLNLAIVGPFDPDPDPFRGAMAF